MNSWKTFGLKRNTVLTAGLAVAVVVVFLLLWKLFALHKSPVLYYVAESAGDLCVVFGIMLFLFGKGIAGIVLLLLKVAEVIVTRIAFSMSIVASRFFWIFVVIFAVFVVIYFWPPVGTGTSSSAK